MDEVEGFGNADSWCGGRTPRFALRRRWGNLIRTKPPVVSLDEELSPLRITADRRACRRECEAFTGDRAALALWDHE